MTRNLKGLVPEGNIPSHVNSYVMQLNPNAPYLTDLIKICRETGYDFEVILSIVLTKTKNFAEFTPDMDLFGVGIGGTPIEQILAACVNGLSSFKLVDELNFSREELEIYDLVYAEVQRVMRLKRISDKPMPLPKKPDPIIPKPTPPVVAQPDKAAPIPTDKPAKKSPSIIGLIPWWVWASLIAIIMLFVAAVIFIPGLGPVVLKSVFSAIMSIVFNR